MKYVYITKSSGCKYCNYFKPVANELFEIYGDSIVEMDIINEQEKEFAKRNFGLKTVPAIAVINEEFNKTRLIDDISMSSVDEIQELINQLDWTN